MEAHTVQGDLVGPATPRGERATVAATAFTVLGTIVGAYFGVRVGAHGKNEAEAARAVSEEKVQRLAAAVRPEDAVRVLDAFDGPGGTR